ncbi:hypothetical protein SOV_29150 [Sporomusa ovata DSM 2662]|uniref:Zinc-ribbon domain-containing protein n=1 Tax=Sporomusa ovata TaxID=2378 RepID=A0A0U1KRQ6_9FIRM|nr:zinc-ribbon domain containing protein [Sporomusa ovata]EQB24884.1 zinc-ribbon domain containing protein [Sporomusa ovata DSM 2662]CQR70081.1 hypothetical protein SpAn4DRAFT_4593 [Sporomusa ovata]
MQCPYCNELIKNGADTCPHCGHTLAVTVLSRQERDGFNGITIEGDNVHAHHGHDSRYESGAAPKVKRINLSFGSYGWAGNLMAAAILAVLLFFFLPVLLLILLVIGAAFIGIWLLRMIVK